jgi:YD repeat-containing protein
MSRGRTFKRKLVRRAGPVTAKYTYIPKLSVIQKWSSVYDSSSQTIGLLSETIDPLNASTNYSYDADAKVASMQFAGDGGVTPAQNYTYDPDGRPATATSAVFGTQTNTYDSDGRTTAVEEPRNGGVTLPATISYAYYPDGARKRLSVSTTSQTLTNLLSYSYRADGLEQTENFDYSGTADTFLFTFTSAGRITNQTDLHGADSWSYDTYGRLAGHSIPAGSYSAYSYDPEGQVTARTGYNGVNETLAYNVRGELTQDLFSNDTYNGCATGSPRPDNPMFEGVDQEGGDGVMHPFQYMLHPCGSGSSTTTDAGALWDARTGVITDGGSGDVTYGYDVAGRQINSASAWSYSNKCGDQTCSNSGTGKFNQTYDAQNHLAGQVYGSWNFISQNITGCMVAPGPMQQKYIGDQTVGYDWGPNGHPIRIGASPFALDVLSTNPSPAPQSQISYDTVHWDGDSLLFTSNSSGTIDDIKIGTIAEYVPGAPNGVTVLDRDQSGLVVSTHNNAGVGAWTPGSPYRQNCSGNATPTVQQTLAADQQAGEGPISEPATDGIFDGFNVIQGVRAMNNATGQWTTPDAYTGDIRDPMSERAYLWNRNNPVTYRDPTGYCAECWIIPFEIALRPIPLADDGRHGVPEKAFRIANFVEKHAVPPAGYEGGGKFENRNGELPAGGQYKEYDVNASVAGKARKGRGTERLVRDSKTGAWYYTDSHYDQKPFGENFTKLNPLWLTPSSVYSPSGVEPSPESARAY